MDGPCSRCSICSKVGKAGTTKASGILESTAQKMTKEKVTVQIGRDKNKDYEKKRLKRMGRIYRKEVGDGASEERLS